MNKATGAALCALLVATPFLTLLLGIQSEAQRPLWNLQAQQLLDYARRQPGRLAAYATGHRPLSLGKVVHDASSAVSAIPDSTIHAAGAAMVSLKHGSIEGLRSFLQGAEKAYLWSSDRSQVLYESLVAARQPVYARIAALEATLPDLKARLPSYTVLKHNLGRPVTTTIELTKAGWEWVGPGGRLHPQEFLERYYGHIIIECVLAVVIGYLFLQQSFKWSSKKEKPLTEEEIDALCEEWEPEPLHKTLPESKLVYETPVISSTTGTYVTANGQQALNMVAFNFLGTVGDPKILEACQATVSKYGVGACGPRGFYGTIDVHLELEERLAKFMGRQEGIIYAYDLSTIPSVLPAFANAKDLIVVDEAADFAIHNGCNLSRAHIVAFKHNDMEDLERVLKDEVAKHRRLKKPLNRRFIVVEAVYKALGDLAPLAAIARLKHKYKFRLVVDESLAFGVLGASGRGACEHFGLQREDVEIICASMGNALASIGGFCVGDREIVDHQRLSGLGYCFSAALPPFLATAAIGSINVLEEQGQHLLDKVQSNARYLRTGLAELEDLEVVGGPRDVISPVVHIRLADPGERSRDEVLQLLQDIVDEALRKDRVLLTVAKISGLDRVRPPPSIRLAVTANHKLEDIDKAVKGLRSAATAVLAASRRPPNKRR